MIARNPEFIRNAWLELTPQRLIAMPAILGLLFVLSVLSQDALGELGLSLSSAARSLFILLTVLWGSKLAADSLIEEFNQGTWDTQRLSGLSPWRMTLGKLFGGPVFAWYGGLLCLGVMLAARDWSEPWVGLREVLLLVLSALALHALILLGTLRGWRKLPNSVRQSRSRNGAGMLLLIFVVAPQLLTWPRILAENTAETMFWHGLPFAPADFALFCALWAAFWCVFGLYRALREELAFRDPPTAWLSFLVFVCLFIGGWFYNVDSPAGYFIRTGVDQPQPPVLRHLLACGGLSLLFAYALLFQERKDWLRLRRQTSLWQAGERARAYSLTPRWMASLAFTAVLAVLIAALALVLLPWQQGIETGAGALAFLCFLVRDSALLLGLNFTRDQRRADAAAALYLGVLYFIVPALIGAAGQNWLLPAFWPISVFVQPPWLLAGLFQAAAALDFARRRWQELPQ